MCGFAGIYSRQNLNGSFLEKMTASIAHRGPDDEAFYSFNQTSQYWRRGQKPADALRVGLGFRRLAIIDLSEQGAQPMTSADGRYVICFNGEIYNYLELRTQLKTNLRSQSDSEVLLALLAEKGQAALPLLNGIFAFALFDRETKKIVLARDPFGVKPLYYCVTEQAIYFGSEIKVILEALGKKTDLNRELIARYLMNNWVAEPDTLFAGIKKLQPGQLITIHSDLSIESKIYRDWDYSISEQKSSNQWVDELEASLNGAVERQLRSDVPLAFFLSGGVDSSLLAVEASRLRQQPVSTYTVGFKWNRAYADELDVQSARVVAKQFGFDHHEILLEPSVVSLLPKIVKVLEEPIADAAAICSYLICEAAAPQFKVLISGQGGDELFGGYPVYRAGLAAHFAQHLPSPILKAGRSAINALPYSLAGQRLQLVHRLKKLAGSVRRPWPEPFALIRSPFPNENLAELLTPELYRQQEIPFGPQLKLFNHAKSFDPLHQLLYLDTKTYLPNLNLTYTDKTSMAHSLEVRVPLLDLEIARLLEKVPSKLKVGPREDKVLLKLLAERILPRAIVRRKKSGFGLPLRDWLQQELQPLARELLAPSRLLAQGLFNPTIIQTWLNQHRDKTADHSLKIYSLMTLQLWLEEFKVNTF